MTEAFGVTWDRVAPRRVAAAVIATMAALAMVYVPGVRALPEEGTRLVSVIVRELPGAGGGAERAIEASGGEVGRRIGIIGGFVAQVPRAEVPRLARMSGVHSVTPNRRVQMLHAEDGLDPAAEMGSTFMTTKIIESRRLVVEGVTGRGVDVALIDTGVVPVDGLAFPNKVVNGPDLSFESQIEDLRHLDTFGHGTHIGGIIAGGDVEIDASFDWSNHHTFTGVAPGARLVNLKVANAEGVTDVSQVLAAIDWVVQHRNHEGLNIRVLNLSFGTDGTQDYRLDPLAYAVEVAWRMGIVVVTAAGNDGEGTDRLSTPASHPGVIAVGASDPNGTRDIHDDTVPAWSARGDGVRNPDLVAPGRSLVSLRNPGSYIDDHHPEGSVNARFFRGSGTSQAAAVVSGAAALLLEQRPSLTPDQVKRVLVATSRPLAQANQVAQGAGLIDVRAASRASPVSPPPGWEPATGTGSLHLSRGSAIVADEDGEELTGERDIFGTAWDGQAWADLSLQGKTWRGGEWLGNTWAGDCWCGVSWAGKTWAGKTWRGETWAGKTWRSDNWAGKTWAGKTWRGETWAGKTWRGETWAGKTWRGTWHWASAAWQ